MSKEMKWIVGIILGFAVVIVLACGIFGAWRYLFAGAKPEVIIASPPSNYRVEEGQELVVDATATGRSVSRLELYVDGEMVDVATSPAPQDIFSAQLSWEASGAGRHNVEVRALDSGGQMSDPAAIVIEVGEVVAEATPTVPPEATPTPTSPPGATATPTSPPPTATPTSPPAATATPVPPTSTPTATATSTATPTATATPSPPSIEFFKAEPATITEGGNTTLSWGLVSNATSVEIDQGIGGVATPDSRVVSPATTTTYTMTAVGPGGTATASVTVTVNPAGPTEPFNFVAEAPSATWFNNDGESITFHNHATCPLGDNKGYACWRDSVPLEDGSTPARSLITHPKWENGGGITGRYEVDEVIQAGDMFRAKIGFIDGALVGNARWVLGYYDGGYHVLADKTKAYNGSLENFNVDLSSLAGETVDFTLTVWTNGPSNQDWAIWLNARIVRP